MATKKRAAKVKAEKGKPTLAEHLKTLDRKTLEGAAGELIKFTLFALGNLAPRHRGGSGLLMDFDTGKVRSWKSDANDALKAAKVIA